MPFISAIVGAVVASIAGVSGFAALGVIGQFAVRFISGIILNVIGRALSSRDAPEQNGSVIGALDNGADVPRSFIMGYYATTGWLAYHNTWGQSGSVVNSMYTRVTKLSDMPIKTLHAIWVDDKYCTIATTPDANGYGYPLVELSKTETVTEYSPVFLRNDSAGNPEFTAGVTNTTYTNVYGWVKFYDGTQTTADSFLTTNVSTAERPWDSNAIGTGVAYAVTTFRYSSDLFSGFPQLKFVVDGMDIYDYSTGTMGGDNNGPVNQVAALLNGVYYGSNWMYGVQTPVVFDTAQLAAAATFCKQPVPGTAGMTDPEKIAAFGTTTIPARYISGIEVSVDEELGSIIEEILGSCNGKVVDNGWKYKIYTGDVGSSVVAFTDADIISTTEQTFTPFFGLADAINGVTAVYPDPNSAWENESAPPLYVPQYEIEDGNRRMLTNLTLRTVVRKEQVQRVVSAALKEARRARRHTISLPHSFLGIECGDIVLWTSSINGYSSKQFRVDGKYANPNLDIVVDLTEVDPADYSWVAATDFQPVVVGSLEPPVYSTQPVNDFYASAVSIMDSAAVSRKPGIFIGWNREITGRTGLQYEIKVVSTGDIISQGTIIDLTSGGTTITSGIMPSQIYSVRARLLPFIDAAWTTPVTVTTNNIRASSDDVNFGDNINFIQNSNFLAGAEGWIRSGTAPASTETTWNIQPAGSAYAGSTYPTVRFYQNGVSTSGNSATFQNRPLTDVTGTISNGIPVTPGEWIQASVQAVSIRCAVTVGIRWYTEAGAVVSTSANLGVLTNGGGSSTNPESWTRVGGKAVAPATAAYAAILITKQGTLSGADSFLFIHKPMLTKVHQYVNDIVPYKPDGTSIITSAHIQNLAVDNAKIANLAVTDAKIGGAIQSTGFVTGPSGTGWKIDKAGSAEFNTVTIRRQLEVDSATINFTGFTPSSTGSGALFSNSWATVGYTIFVDVTGVPMSAWGGAQKTYLVNVEHTSGGITYTGPGSDAYFGWVGTVLPLTVVLTNPQTLRLKIEFVSRNITAAASGTIRYKIYEVS